MTMDQPVVDYGGKDKKKGSMMATKSEVQELDDLQAAWEKRRQGKRFVGQKVNLSEFVNGKI